MKTQRENFEAWCRSRTPGTDQDTDAPSRNYQHVICGGPGNIFDHGFVAGGFPVWGREMFVACPVEFVLVGEPYRDQNALGGDLRILTRNGFKVWALDDGKFHHESVTTIIAAAVDPVLAHSILIGSEVGGRIPACDYCAFFPRNTIGAALPALDGRAGTASMHPTGWAALESS